MHYNLPSATFCKTIHFATGDTFVQALFTPQGGSRVVVTSLRVCVDSAGDKDPNVLVGFGTASALPELDGVEHDDVVDWILLDACGILKGTSVVIGNGQGIIGYGAKDEVLRCDAEEPGTNGIITITVTGYQEDASSE